jgi:3'-phosphoadenosine 5'-phosphosulfate sulfotransferase (PAPS reductase)/FAD synthetase
MVIKVEAVADSINERLKATYGNVFDVDDKRTWKYYLNLSGQYHSTDKKIYVTSLDTLQTIEFSRDTLAIHRATAKKEMVRFRTLGCYPLTGAVNSTATTLPEIIQEMLICTTSERQGRLIDSDGDASMEKKKQEGYF